MIVYQHPASIELEASCIKARASQRYSPSGFDGIDAEVFEVHGRNPKYEIPKVNSTF
jgi:hypothetical protein